MARQGPKRENCIVIFGGHGLVGNKIQDLLKTEFSVIVPKKSEVSINSLGSLEVLLRATQPFTVINLAAYTDLKEAEKERGNKNGRCWQINVVGVQNIVSICQKLNIPVIHISTDGVFPGTKQFPGPYSEKIKPEGKLKNLSWYGYTKLQAEKTLVKSKLRYSIIRISYPFGNPESEKDFLKKIISYIDLETALFSDQFFTPTLISDISHTIIKLIKLKKYGIFHTACTNITTPFEFGLYTAHKLKIDAKPIEKQFRSTNLQDLKLPKRAQYGGLLTKHTQKDLDIKYNSWKSAIDSTIHDYS